MANEPKHDRTEDEEAKGAELKADQDTERREDEGYSQPESSAQKMPASEPRS